MAAQARKSGRIESRRLDKGSCHTNAWMSLTKHALSAAGGY